MFEQLINGLTQGSVYALLALGFTLIFGTLRMVTFAHGEVYMVGAYVGFEIIRLLHPNLLLALAAALAATAILGMAIELLAFHFLRNAPHSTSLLVTIGISILLVNAAQKIWGPETQAVPFALLDRLGRFEFEVGRRLHHLPAGCRPRRDGPAHAASCMWSSTAPSWGWSSAPRPRTTKPPSPWEST